MSLRRALLRAGSARRARAIQRRVRPLRLDLGCGDHPREGHIGIDLSPRADLRWDLTWGIPFADESVADIRSDHLFEHLDLPIVVEVLRECRRVLEPNGGLDFTVPHIDPYLDAYLRRDMDLLKEKIHDVPPERESLYSTCFDRISWLLLREGEHRSIYDRESIIAKVRQAGFREVRTREYEPSRDTDRRFSSCYVVAVK